jgi:hypothetical protein
MAQVPNIRNVGRHTHYNHKTGGRLDGRASKDLADDGHSLTFVIKKDYTGATAEQQIYNSNAPFKFTVLDVWCVQTGGAGGASDTALLDNGTTAITDTMDLNKADKIITRCATIDDAAATIAQNGSLHVTTASSAVGTMHILCARSA